MKLIAALTSAQLATITARITCNTPPYLGKGVWTCPNFNVWNQGETCRVSEDGCAGDIRCWNGRWKGNIKRFCPKDCEGTPRQPDHGGQFVCENKTCELAVFDGFKCDSDVKCNTYKGKWEGKTKCEFEVTQEIRNNPPARPNGNWSCKGKCIFTCNDGTNVGTGEVGKTGWVFSTDWNICFDHSSTPILPLDDSVTRPTISTIPTTTDSSIAIFRIQETLTEKLTSISKLYINSQFRSDSMSKIDLQMLSLVDTNVFFLFKT